MKKIIISTICIVLGIIFASCADSRRNSKNVGESMNDKTTLNTGQIDSTNHPTVPTAICFSSIYEIQEFLTMAKSSEANFEKYSSSHDISNTINQKKAKKVMTNIISHPLPIANSNTVVDGFGATYYAERDQLDLVYRINNCRYRFIYSYNSVDTQKYEGAPVLKNVTMGSHMVDLYQGDDCLIGSITTETATITVIVYSNQLDFQLSQIFEFGKIQ